MKKSRQAAKWKTFFEVFSPLIWLTIFCTNIVVTLVLIKANSTIDRKNIDLNSSWVTIGLAMMALDVKQSPNTLTTRIIVAIVCFYGVFLYWSYNAAFVSFLTVVI